MPSGVIVLRSCYPHLPVCPEVTCPRSAADGRVARLTQLLSEDTWVAEIDSSIP